MERAKYGSLTSLTPEQYKKHKASISARWRKAHKNHVKQYNKDWYEYNKANGKHICTCKVCGKKFKSHRSTAKICQKCLKKH